MREITEYDGYKLHPKRKREVMSEEEKRTYDAEKAEARKKSEELLKIIKINENI